MTLSVLLVDDNPHFLRVLDRFLTVHGDGDLRVVGSVVGGQGAITEVQRLMPDIVIVDLKMPDVPGLRLLPQLRQTSPDTILIALSLLAMDESRDDALAAGADAFISKASLECDLIPAIRRCALRTPGAHAA
jgi:DNA-binding NarL/FixJ family response regulator